MAMMWKSSDGWLPRLIGCGLVFLVAACTGSATETVIAPTELVADTPAPTATLPATATVGIQPTLAPVPGTINVENASCRVGPGGGYLLRQVLHDGAAVEITATLDLNTNWVLVRVADSGSLCWINTNLIDFPTDSAFNIVNDPHVVLPYSSYYSPLRGVTATRNEDVVRVRWDPLALREGDRIEDTPYVLAAWVCQNGEFVFRAVGTREFAVFIRDEQGCEQSSHGLVMGAEKHGYTAPVVVDWP